MLLADENIEKSLVIELKERGFDIRYCDKGLKNSEVIPVLPIEEMVEILLKFFSRFKGEFKGKAFLLSKEEVIVFESKE